MKKLSYNFILLILLVSTNICFATTNQNNCIVNNNYIIHQKSLQPNVGNNYDIWKYSSNISTKLTCPMSSTPYMQIKSDNSNSHDALSYLFLYKNILALDNGTSADPRDLNIYDLNLKKQVYSTKYYAPIEHQNNTVNFWVAKLKSNPTQCLNYMKTKNSGMNMVVVEKVSLNLNTIKLKHLSQTKCLVIQ